MLAHTVIMKKVAYVWYISREETLPYEEQGMQYINTEHWFFFPPFDITVKKKYWKSHSCYVYPHSSGSGMIILYCKKFKYLAWKMFGIKAAKVDLESSYLWNGDKHPVKISHDITAILVVLVIQVAGYRFLSAGSPQQLEIIACCRTV